MPTTSEIAPTALWASAIDHGRRRVEKLDSVLHPQRFA
jgi:hypothetical protein